MPYITQNRRAELLEGGDMKQVGELNYLISVLVNEYIETTGLSYTNLNSVVGVLDCAKMEVYRRLAAPYEDTKIKENGDVFTVGVKSGPTPGDNLDFIFARGGTATDDGK